MVSKENNREKQPSGWGSSGRTQGKLLEIRKQPQEKEIQVDEYKNGHKPIATSINQR